MTVGSRPIKNPCEALEDFILSEAQEWARNYPSIWSWIAALDGLTTAGCRAETKAVQYALKSILEQ